MLINSFHILLISQAW